MVEHISVDSDIGSLGAPAKAILGFPNIRLGRAVSRKPSVHALRPAPTAVLMHAHFHDRF